MREAQIENHLIHRIAELGGECRKVSWPGRRGAPDRAVFLPGRLVWVELKAPGKKAQSHQRREHQRLRALGQTVLVIDSIAEIDRHFPAAQPAPPTTKPPILWGLP